MEGFSPLHYAAGEGFLEITRYLVEKCGADPEVPDNLGLTPGFCAVLQVPAHRRRALNRPDRPESRVRPARPPRPTCNASRPAGDGGPAAPRGDGRAAAGQGRADVADYLLRSSPRGVHARNVSSDTMLHCALKVRSRRAARGAPAPPPRTRPSPPSAARAQAKALPLPPFSAHTYTHTHTHTARAQHTPGVLTPKTHTHSLPSPVHRPPPRSPSSICGTSVDSVCSV